MKKLLTLIAAVFISIQLFAQSPQKMSYQAVIRNASNNLVTNAPVKMKISILQGSTTGTAVYSELHSATTNANGLVTIEIGGGTSQTGTFSSINWGSGTYFLKTETDPNNGTNYSIVGTSQLLSVPYALESKSAGDGIKGVSSTGDTVFLNNGKKYIIPGIKDLNPPSTINNGLVGYWPFNGNANDESGNGNNGTVNGATLTTDRFGAFDKSFLYNGTTDFIALPVLNMSSYNQFSLSVWVYVTNFQTSWTNYHIVRQDDGGPGGNLDWLVAFQNNGNTISFGLGIQDKPYTELDLAITPTNFIGKWNNIVVTYNGTNKYIYINGNLIGSELKSGLINYTSSATHATGSACSNVNCIEKFKGKIDDIRIYNRALTQQEITYLANN